jgi:hypothetical protein
MDSLDGGMDGCSLSPLLSESLLAGTKMACLHFFKLILDFCLKTITLPAVQPEEKALAMIRTVI